MHVFMFNNLFTKTNTGVEKAVIQVHFNTITKYCAYILYRLLKSILSKDTNNALNENILISCFL